MSIQKGFVWLGCIFLAIYLATGINPGSAAEFTYEPVVPSSKFLGIHGMAFDSSDRLYVGSILGQSIYTVDTSTGNVEVHVGPPNGMADDMEFAPDGTLVWTSFLLGKVTLWAAMDKFGSSPRDSRVSTLLRSRRTGGSSPLKYSSVMPYTRSISRA